MHRNTTSTYYRPTHPFNVPFRLWTAQGATVKGSYKKTYTDSGIINASFRTFGGTEVVKDGVLSVENTAVIETWFRPDIKADSRLEAEDGTMYEVFGTPENINGRNQFLYFKIKAIKGGA